MASIHNITGKSFAFVVCVLYSPVFAQSAADDVLAVGEGIYRFYCYQCHAYSGTGDSLAAKSLDPPPRNFTATSVSEIDAAQMTNAVANGRQGTGMPSFSSVLTEIEIDAVVTYVRTTFMGPEKTVANYHSAVNGWNSHDRYKAAYDFSNSIVSINSPTHLLTNDQLRGRALYLSACISCHEQRGPGADNVVWELRAVSYPRKHFSHREPQPDLISAASPYALHDQPAMPVTEPQRYQEGMILYQDNCAFCHAADGTGKNWIGSFLEPRPRDFTARGFLLLNRTDELKAVIRDGLAERSMPAWRHVLSESEISEIVSYMQAAFAQQPINR